MKRKICVVTGTRAEYGLLKTVMASIQSQKSLELALVVGGMHLSGEFGQTISQIKKDHFRIDHTFRMDVKDDQPDAMATALGRGVIEMTKALKEIKPQIVLVLGDRIEALAAALASVYSRIPLAHIHGGDISKAGLDESARHAITKLANIHFPATLKSKERILKMGEKRAHVFLVGAPGLDDILNSPVSSIDELRQLTGFDFHTPVILMVQHSVTTQMGQAKTQIKETLDAVKRLKMNTIIIYPNSDSGGRVIIAEIEKCRSLNFVKIFKNLSRREYLGLLKHASVLVGNSSSGIIESAAFQLPVINIGIRQDGRERSCNVVDVSHQSEVILRAIQTVLNKNFKKQLIRCRSPYGNGQAGTQIAKILSAIPLDFDLLQKQLAF